MTSRNVTTEHTYRAGQKVAHVSDPKRVFGVVEFGDSTGANVIELDGDIAWFEAEDILPMPKRELNIIGLVAATALASLVVGIATGVAFADRNPTNVPCPTEDSIGCYWDADIRGNGEGTSFIVTDRGNVYYLDESGE